MVVGSSRASLSTATGDDWPPQGGTPWSGMPTAERSSRQQRTGLRSVYLDAGRGVSLAFKPSGALAIGHPFRTVTTCDLAGDGSKETNHIAGGAGGSSQASALSADGTRFACAVSYFDDPLVYISSVANDTPGSKAKGLKDHKKPVQCMAFRPDGKLLASGAQDQIRLWDAATGKTVRVLSVAAGTRLIDLAFSPDGKTLVSLGDGLLLWDVSGLVP